jgi:hypothetical protein
MEARVRNWLWCATFVGVLGGCVPELDESNPRVDEPRVLAVRAEPAEVAPRARARFTALYADASGSLSEAELDWAYCVQRKSLAELGPISPACLVPEGESLAPLGAGLSAEGAVPADACRLFGPDRPMAKPGEPAGRPVDADPTGGYYQPLRLFDRAEDSYAIFEARIRCGLPGVTMAQFAEFNRRYQINSNPELEAVAVIPEAGEPEPLAPAESGEAFTVAAGETLDLRVTWASCPELPECEDAECPEQPACGGAEQYAYFDPASRSVLLRREAMRVSWHATAGSFRDGRTGRSPAEVEHSNSENQWTAPDAPGPVVLWAVLRDDRGGVAWQSYRFQVDE